MKRLPIPDPIFFKPVKLGALSLAHRFVMPAISAGIPLQEGVPTGALADHYRDRATFGGLLITEPVRAVSNGHLGDSSPGLFDNLQVNGWREVTGAVHRQGGLVVVHLGVPEGTAAAIGGIDKVMRRLRSAAENAGDAGFDGIELDAGAAGVSGIALGSQSDPKALDDRGYLLLEMLETLAGVFGNDRLGIWTMSPAQSVVSNVLQQFGQAGVAYVHLPCSPGADSVDGGWGFNGQGPSSDRMHPNVIIRGVSLGDLPASALQAGTVAAVSHGAAFLANPDLPRRLLQGLSLTSVESED
jgi:N-ethylmaleimide reductase